MGKRAADLSGDKYGALVVLSRHHSDVKSVSWMCACDCGNIHVVYGQNLRNGSTKSCGCINHKLIHGGTGTRIYQTWQSMLARCNSDSYHAAKHYKQRGITVCDEWLDFKTFRSWALANGYKDNLTLDRKRNDKGYAPGNCRFITIQDQQRNKGNHHYLDHNGKTQRIFEWSNELHISQSCICNRLAHGWSVSKTLSTPTKRIRP